MVQARTEKEFAVLGLGEVLLRLSPPNKERILAGEVFEKRAGGSELNVVSGISLLGLRTGIVTKLPDNEIGKYIKNRIRFSGVSDDYIIYDSGKNARLGIYYYESGAAPRKPTVVYDRANSSFTSLALAEIPADVYSKTAVFHFSGITMALGANIREALREMIANFKANGTLISFDVNFRATLWSEAEARAEILKILPQVDILFVSEETLRKMFGRTGTVDAMMKEFAAEFGCKLIATTQRQVLSPTRHTWNSLIYSREEDRYYQEEPYPEIEVVDRIGSGDAYLAGVLFGLLKFGAIQPALEFGNAMAAIKNTIPGDMPVSDFHEIRKVITDHQSHNSSELNR
ncbi:2-dehydro-3-deoxygluconokinase [Hydrogenispora ethanolica]|uniref:2-dehydro-3-deoxygluconokinase n=1 Tax=Hydrogenispora ethanolica TaxID=1082276 RepID=A0A4R1R9C2_HYDET|nr:sugar kinase [Hydrogenispora ethanolica]TCL62179.1 2-dehydro-3-deoxygluconokinase [Hydrogenispora ethanolica]